MLGKLLKHEFKATYRTQCAMYLVVLLLSVISMFFGIAAEANPTNGVLMIFSPIAKGTAVIVKIALLAVTFIMAILRYRKNLLKDEGYLMNTLPVKKWQLHISKLIVPYVWMIIDMLVIYLSVALELREIDFLGLINLNGFAELEAMGFTVGMWLLIILALAISLASSFSMFYLALNVGYTVSKDKDLMSFVAYIVIYIINQIVGVIEMLLMVVLNMGDISNMVNDNMEVFPINYFRNVMLIALVTSVIMCVLYNIVSVYVLDKKLNLE